MASYEYGTYFKIIQRIGRIILPKLRLEHLPEQKEATVYVSHHNNMFGPVSVLCWFPDFIRPWVFSPFLDQEACYNQYVNYTFTERFGLPMWLAKPIAWLASYAVSSLMQSLRSIPVYRQSRKIVHTFRESIATLKDNQAIIIFPNIDYEVESQEVGELYEGFLNLDKYYYKDTGQHIQFVPLYANRETREILHGDALAFNDTVEFKQQRSQMATELAEQLNVLAQSSLDE